MKPTRATLSLGQLVEHLLDVGVFVPGGVAEPGLGWSSGHLPVAAFVESPRRWQGITLEGSLSQEPALMTWQHVSRHSRRRARPPASLTSDSDLVRAIAGQAQATTTATILMAVLVAVSVGMPAPAVPLG